MRVNQKHIDFRMPLIVGHGWMHSKSM